MNINRYKLSLLNASYKMNPIRRGMIQLSKRDKGYSQKGKPNSDTVKATIAAEELEKAIHPTKRQNSEQ